MGRLSIIKDRIIHNGTPPVSATANAEPIETVTTEQRPTSAEDARKFLPVKLEDVFKNGQYLIKGHLGSGRYSSVWLTEDLESKQYYAMKILNSDFYNGEHDLFELEVMEKVATVSAASSHPGRNHVAQLVDHFEVKGPSGTHVCMVFVLLGSSIAKQAIESKIEHLPAHAVKQIAHQLLQALDFIHTECQVIHTDISPQNICLDLSDPATVVGESQADSDGNIELTTPSLVHNSEIFKVRLNDFGIACFFDRHLTDRISPPLLRAPEVTLGAPWDEKVDIFNLGALILQFITGQLPFPGKGERNTRWCHESDRLAQLIENFGGEPDIVLENADRAEEFKANGVDLEGKTRRIGDGLALDHWVAGNTVGTGLSIEEVPLLCDLLRHMLATDPRRRQPARVLLAHPWLQGLNVDY